MSPAPSGGRVTAKHALASMLLALASAGCPGPEPDHLSGDGGGAASTSSGSTGATSTGSTGDAATSSSSSKASTGVGGGAGVGGAGSTTGVGGSSQVGSGGHGGDGAGGCDADLESDLLNCGACDWACSNFGAEDVRCEEGRCKHLCRDGFSNVTRPEAPEEDDDGCETAWRRVFVTRDPQPLPFVGDNASEIGAAAADAVCAGLADAAGLDGTWRAWISDDLIPPPRERFTPYEAPYWLLDGTVIAESFGDVVDGALDAPIHVTETEDSLFELFPNPDMFPVWTATDVQGEATPSNCSDWAPAGGEDQLAHIGVVAEYEQMNLADAAWTQHPIARSCLSEGARLYCFEQ